MSTVSSACFAVSPSLPRTWSPFVTVVIKRALASGSRSLRKDPSATPRRMIAANVLSFCRVFRRSLLRTSRSCGASSMAELTERHPRRTPGPVDIPTTPRKTCAAGIVTNCELHTPTRPNSIRVSVLLWLQDDMTTFGLFHRFDATLSNPGRPATDWSFMVPLPDGNYALSARATDTAGNERSITPWRHFNVDADDTTDPLIDADFVFGHTFRVLAGHPVRDRYRQRRGRHGPGRHPEP